MRIIRKVFVALLTLLVVLSIYSLSAVAAEAALLQRANGLIVGQNDTDITIRQDQTDKDVVINLSGAYIVDYVSGQPVALKDRTSDKAVVYYRSAEAEGIPPRNTAAVVICNIDDYINAPLFGRVEGIVERTENQVKVLIQNGGIAVTVNKDTPISPYLTKNIVTIDDISVGSELLAWCSLILNSYPGQSTADKLVLFSNPAANHADGFSIGNRTLEGKTNVSGSLPVFNGDAAITERLNMDAENFYTSTVAGLEANEVANFRYETIYSDEYISVKIFASLPSANTSDERVYTIVVKAENFDRQWLTDLLGPNGVKIANDVISEGIAAANPGSFYTDEDEFGGLNPESNFYINGENAIVIIFNKYEIAPGAAGMPEFSIDTADINNVRVPRSDVFTNDNEVDYLPLRAVAEGLGYTVAWEGASRSVQLSKNGESYSIVIGNTEAGGAKLEAAPMLRADRTYVPTSFFELALDGYYEVEAEAVTVSSYN